MGAYWISGSESTSRSLVAMWFLEPGTKLPDKGWKRHPVEEVEYVVSGQAKLQLAADDGTLEKEYMLKPGDLFFQGGGVWHRLEVVGNEPYVGLLFVPEPCSVKSGQPASFSEQTE